jgi:NAD+ synthase
MRDYQLEFDNRVAFIKRLLEESGAKGIIFGNSGGKDSALVGILCKAACDNTVGVVMPCSITSNYETDKIDADALAKQHNIETRIVDLTPVREAELKALEGVVEMTPTATMNIAPRLRMTTLYAIAGAERLLVAGTSNRSEIYVGYSTKWGDGAHDFNPISDLTATEVFEFLRCLDAPKSIVDKVPSAGLFEGQTDEKEMGVTYAELDSYINGGEIPADKKERIDRLHRISEHKRTGVVRYGE